MKTNKKRTILALVGIILSVALISAIGLFFLSMQESQKQDIMQNYGSFHIGYIKVDDALLAKIKSNPKVTRSGLYKNGDKIKIRDDLNGMQIFASGDTMKLLPAKISTGRFPEKTGEIALEKWFAKSIKYDAKIGDTLKIGDSEYTLTGLLQDNIDRQSKQEGIILIRDDAIQVSSAYLLVEFDTRGNFKKTLDDAKTLADAKNILENKHLTMMEGQGLPKGMIQVLSIIIGIVVISTIAVIYNAFQISVVERVKQFGLLRAVGATPKQIRKIILREAVFLSAIGIPIGLLCGILAMFLIYIIFKLIAGGSEMAADTVTFMYPTISIGILLFSAGIAVLAVFASAILPALFAGRISPLVAISSRNSISKEKIKREKGALAGKIFGFEGTLASKNIKRNRKRYRTTVFSIIISVMLFVTFKSFMDMSLNIYGDDMNETKKIHFSIGSKSQESPMKEDSINKIKDIKGVKQTYNGFPNFWFSVAMDKSREVKEVRENSDAYNDVNFNGEKTLLSGNLEIYDNNKLEASKGYISSGSLDYETINKENGVIIVNSNQIYNLKTKKTFFGAVSNLKVGDEIYLQADPTKTDKNAGAVEFGKSEVKKVKVMAILDKDPFDRSSGDYALKMITTPEVATKLVSKEIKTNELNLILDNENKESSVNGALDKIASEDSGLKVVNYIDGNKSQKSIILMVQILMYGFVVVVSLIGSVNIINTLTTNIILRRREFGALKSIGLTQKGLKKLIVLEGTLYGIVGGIYGSIIGCGLSYLMFRGMNAVREQHYNIPLDAMAIAVGGAILIGYLSVLAPLRRIGKDNLIESLREEA